MIEAEGLLIDRQRALHVSISRPDSEHRAQAARQGEAARGAVLVGAARAHTEAAAVL